MKCDLVAGKNYYSQVHTCRVAGLRNFLGEEYEDLLCIDIVCHEGFSPAVWKRYLEWQESKVHGKVTAVDFRNKIDFGWRTHVETLSIDNEKNVSSRVFTRLFYGHAVLRPCCYVCPYKSIMHPGDITIADYWGIEKAAPEFDDNKGVSLMLINNNKGEEVFESVNGSLHWQSTQIEDSMQPPLKTPFPKPKNREQFWKDYNNKNFEYIAKKYGGYGFINKVKRKLGASKRKLLKN